MELVYKATIPLDPKTKKNSQKIAYRHAGMKQIPFIVQGDIYTRYALQACHVLAYGYRIDKTIDYPVQAVFRFYRKEDRRVDLGNLEAAICDILVDAGIIADDNYKIIQSMDGSRVYIDRKNPRTEIEIYKLEEEDHGND